MNGHRLSKFNLTQAGKQELKPTPAINYFLFLFAEPTKSPYFKVFVVAMY
jgi:hypothetical protein